MLLRWYTEVCGSDVDKNVALLAIIHKFRLDFHHFVSAL